MDYPDGTPEDWYAGKTVVVAGDRLSFADEVCYGPTHTHRRGGLSDVLKAFRKDSSAKLKEGFGVADAGPFDYLEVHCASGQYLQTRGRHTLAHQAVLPGQHALPLEGGDRPGHGGPVHPGTVGDALVGRKTPAGGAIMEVPQQRAQYVQRGPAERSTVRFDHITMLGRYTFILPDQLARGELRPLRDTGNASDES